MGIHDVKYQYSHLFSGFSSVLNDSQLKMLESHSEVDFVFESKCVKKQTTYSYKFLGLDNSVNGLWKKTTGSGSIVGVIDTGIWPELPSFSDSGIRNKPSKFKGVCDKGSDKLFKCNKKVIGARFFAHAYTVNRGYSGLAHLARYCGEYASARDADGHGSHTASTAAGSVVQSAMVRGRSFGTPKGMAVSAHIAVYKALWCGGEGETADIAAAIDAAVADGVDVLSLSVGGDPDKGSYLTNDVVYFAALKAHKAGVSVAFSGGNGGPGAFTVTHSPPWVLTVGAVHTDKQFKAVAVLGNNQTLEGNAYWESAGLKDKYGLVYCENASVDRSPLAKYCNYMSLSTEKTKNRVVLCSNGGDVSFYSSQLAVKLSKGVAVLVYDGKSSNNLPVVDKNDLPTLALSYAKGNILRNYTKTSKHPRIGISATYESIGSIKSRKEAPVVADFSSRGPSYLSLSIVKPDLVAPGVDIFAAIPTTSDALTWDVLQGTSVACPHVSGVLALLKSVHPTWTPSMLFSALTTTAVTTTNKGNKIQNSDKTAATPFDMGAGLINPNKAVDPGLVLPITNTDYDNFFCTADNGKRSFCSNYKTLKAVDLNLPSVTFYSATVGKTVSTKRVLTNVGPASTYRSTVVSPPGSTLVVSPNTMSFSSPMRNISFSVKLIANTVSSKVKGATLTRRYSNDLYWTFGSITWYNNMGHSVKMNVALNTQ